MDGRSYKNYNIALSHSKVTTTSIYPYLGHLKVARLDFFEGIPPKFEH